MSGYDPRLLTPAEREFMVQVLDSAAGDDLKRKVLEPLLFPVVAGAKVRVEQPVIDPAADTRRTPGVVKVTTFGGVPPLPTGADAADDFGVVEHDGIAWIPAKNCPDFLGVGYPRFYRLTQEKDWRSLHIPGTPGRSVHWCRKDMQDWRDGVGPQARGQQRNR